jgi:hypothetical protein
MKLGDVIFQDLLDVSLIDLIDKVQGGPPNHCGIVTGFWFGIPLITEAFPGPGVWTIPFPLFLARSPFSTQVRGWGEPSVVSGIITYVKSQKGLPYNIHFDDSNSSVYCSELIAKGYKYASGKDISCTKVIADLETKLPWAKQMFFSLLGVYPEADSKIWLVTDLLNAKELKKC